MGAVPFPPISEAYPLVLASASPRRHALLGQVGIPFLAMDSALCEETGASDPETLVTELARAKAGAVLQRSRQGWTLGADTLVVLGRMPLGKPRDASDARAMLRLLSEKEHRVLTGFTLLDPEGGHVHSQTVSTLVRVKRLSPKEIDAYVRSGEPMGKAGAYAIQGIGAFMVEGITGCYFNVVGLPLSAVIQTLLASGALPAFPFPGP